MDDIKPIDLGVEEPATITTQPEVKPAMQPKQKKNIALPIILTVMLVGGVVLGTTLAKKHLLMASGNSASGATMAQNPTSAGAVKVGDTFGATDESTFRDQAEGILQPGGIEGEGSHHIERGANASQWVYVTSSVIDLDNFVGDKVTVWGETNAGKKAGWLMDVGRLKVQELHAAEINNIEPAE